MFRKKNSKILKLPPVRNCFTLAMTNKLVVIINSLKVPKIKKILLYEMKFLLPNYSCLQNPWLEGYRPQIPFLSVLYPQLNLLNPPKQNSWVRHCTLWRLHVRGKRGFTNWTERCVGSRTCRSALENRKVSCVCWPYKSKFLGLYIDGVIEAAPVMCVIKIPFALCTVFPINP